MTTIRRDFSWIYFFRYTYKKPLLIARIHTRKRGKRLSSNNHTSFTALAATLQLKQNEASAQTLLTHHTSPLFLMTRQPFTLQFILYDSDLNSSRHSTKTHNWKDKHVVLQNDWISCFLVLPACYKYYIHHHHYYYHSFCCTRYNKK